MLAGREYLWRSCYPNLKENLWRKLNIFKNLIKKFLRTKSEGKNSKFLVAMRTQTSK